MKQRKVLNIIIILILYLGIININIIRFKINLLSSLNYYIQRPIILSLETIITLLISFFLIKFLKSKRKVFDILGLSKKIAKGWFIAFLFTLPMLIGFLFVAPLQGFTQKSLLMILYNAILAGFVEELIFRAFPIAFLHRILKVGFLPTILITSFLFAFMHIGQGNGDISEIINVLLITFIGSFVFGWVFIEWDYNLWIPIGLHTFMNMYWMAFDLNSPNVVGSYWANLFRGISILLIISITLWRVRKNGSNLKRKWILIKN